MPETLDRLKTALADRYLIEREIGRGGMAMVYLAHDVKHDRKVAVKVLRPELSASIGADRFLREIKIAASLNHPHILPLLDSGAAEERPSDRPSDRPPAFLYYVMPHVEGESLREKLSEEGELPVLDAVRMLRDITDALAHAHEHGVVHRDIKPENIMISGRHAFMMDFGVAKALSEATERGVTDPGSAVGTPDYMAPEQAGGDSQTDCRADIYAVGAVAYEVLTGQPPFVRESRQDTIAAHALAPAEPLTNLRAEVPPGLEALTLRCLEKEPADRWQRADAMLPHLDELIATPSGGVTPVPSLVRAAGGERSWWSKKKPLGALAVGAAVIVATSWVAHSRGSTRIAVLSPTHIGSEETRYVSEGLADEVNNLLVGLDGLEVKGRVGAERYVGTTTPDEQIGRELNVDYLLRMRVRTQGSGEIRAAAELIDAEDGVAVWSDIYDVGSDLQQVFDVHSRIARGVASALHLEESAGTSNQRANPPTEDAEAYDLYRRARYRAAKRTPEDLRVAADLYRESIQLDSGFAEAWAGLGQVLVVQPTWDPAASPAVAGTVTREVVNKALSLDPDNVEALATDGRLKFLLERDYAGAEAAFERALAVNPDDPVVNNFYGDLLRFTLSRRRAIELERRAVELEPVSLTHRFDLGLEYLENGDTDAGFALLESGLELEPDHVPSLSWLATWLLRVDLIDSAEAVIDHLEGVADTGSFYVEAARFAKALKFGERDEAVAIADRARDSVEKKGFGFCSPAFYYYQLGMVDEVVELLRRSEDVGDYRSLPFDPEAYPNHAGYQAMWEEDRFSELKELYRSNGGFGYLSRVVLAYVDQ